MQGVLAVLQHEIIHQVAIPIHGLRPDAGPTRYQVLRPEGRHQPLQGVQELRPVPAAHHLAQPDPPGAGHQAPEAREAEDIGGIARRE